MKEVLVSIIVAAYNEENYIDKLIDSVKEQSYKNWELIIVDDNSKDNTFSIITDLSKKDPKIKVYQQQKDLKGPGNAWNLAVSKSKGKILFFEGADTILGKYYIKDMLKPIIEGNAIGTLHKEEKIANKENLWARAFGIRKCVDRDNQGIIFGAISRRYFEKAGGFDPSLGYADDQTLYNKLKMKSLGVNAEIYHHNPDTFKEIWRHHKWVGASFKSPWKVVLIFPIFPIWVIYKSITQLRQDYYFNFIWFLPIYNTIRYFGYLDGIIRKKITKKIY
jgi:glycosyltransferase involved in cell wall biosynthesis